MGRRTGPTNMAMTNHPNDGCMIVVDDPHGYVAPSPGVQIVGRSQGKTLGIVGSRYALAAAVSASMLINMGYERTMEIERPRVMTRKAQEPRIKGSWKKPKRLHKGLRP